MLQKYEVLLWYHLSNNTIKKEELFDLTSLVFPVIEQTTRRFLKMRFTEVKKLSIKCNLSSKTIVNSFGLFFLLCFEMRNKIMNHIALKLMKLFCYWQQSLLSLTNKLLFFIPCAWNNNNWKKKPQLSSMLDYVAFYFTGFFFPAFILWLLLLYDLS